MSTGTDITASVAIATYNVFYELADDTAVADIQKLASTSVDVIGLQEMGSRARREAMRGQLIDCSSCRFDAFIPDGARSGAVPILYRSATFELLGSGAQKVSDSTYVGPDGAGPSTVGPKFLTYVLLRHRATGQDMYVINSHAVASVQAGSGGPDYDHPERLALYRLHMDGLRAMITKFEATGAAVFTTGDFNVNYRRDVVLQDELFPYFNMSQVNLFPSYDFLGTPDAGTTVGVSGATGTRLIDYVSALDHPAVAAKEQTILMGYRSDHRPVLVRYAIAAVPGAPTSVRAESAERSAKVSWTPAPDNGAAVTDYVVTATPGGAHFAASGDATSTTVPGLTNGTDYTFTVQATNRMGTGPGSAASNPVTPFAVLPQTAITTGPVRRAFVTSTNARFSYSSDATDSSFACLLDGVGRACGASSLKLSSLAQRTHVFSVAARDADGDIDASPATRSWTIPLNNTALTHSAGWRRKTGSGYFMDTYSQTTRRDAVLTRRVSGIRELVLVAAKGPGHGTVKIYLGSTLLKQVMLGSGSLTKRQVLPIAKFSSDQTGKVRVVVTSAGKTVRVEGLGVATR